MNQLEGQFLHTSNPARVQFLHLIKRSDSNKESAWRSIFTPRGQNQMLLVSSVYKHCSNFILLFSPTHLFKNVPHELFSVCFPSETISSPSGVEPLSLHSPGAKLLFLCVLRLYMQSQTFQGQKLLYS